MSFDAFEASTQEGRPSALYLIEWGGTEWSYTSADRSITYGLTGAGAPRVYQPKAISDSGMVQGGSSQNDFTVEAPIDLPLVELFRGTPPSGTLKLTVRRQHTGDAEAPIYWKGYITNVKRVGDAKALIVGLPLTASFKRTGLRLCWTRECPHFLYDSNCRVDPEDFRVDTTVLSITGNAINVGAVGGHGNGHFTGGYVAWEATAEGTTDRRMIESHTGLTLTLFGRSDGISVGDAVALYPGCNRTPSVCHAKFNNKANYGGFDFMPGQTPFGTIIF